jgi:hypothetical protein
MPRKSSKTDTSLNPILDQPTTDTNDVDQEVGLANWDALIKELGPGFEMESVQTAISLKFGSAHVTSYFNTSRPEQRDVKITYYPRVHLVVMTKDKYKPLIFGTPNLSHMAPK